MKLILKFAGPLLLLTGCSLEPNMETLAMPVSSRFPGVKNFHDPSAVDIPWRKFLLEPRLRRLIELALKNNRDLRIAVLNVETTRAQYGITASVAYPELSAQASFNRDKSNERISENWRASLASTSYELDLFGRVRCLSRGALEKFLATAEAQRAARIALISEVATRYYSTRLAEEQVAVARKTLESVQGSFEINKARADAGESNELDLRSSQGQVETARINLLTYERDVKRGCNALVLLIGCPLPANLPQVLDVSGSRLLSSISPGFPSDLIRNRPDILQAEHNLLASNADIGAARAAFFPSITLTGSSGSSTAEFSNLLGGSAVAWNFAPQIKVPIFDGGRNRATLASAESGKQIQLANYEKAIQTAFREVADALVEANSLDRQVPVSGELVKTQAARLQLAGERFLQGEAPYLEVLNAQQDLFNAELRHLDARFKGLESRILLYKSLGGGWK